MSDIKMNVHPEDPEWIARRVEREKRKQASDKFEALAEALTESEATIKLNELKAEIDGIRAQREAVEAELNKLTVAKSEAVEDLAGTSDQQLIRILADYKTKSAKMTGQINEFNGLIDTLSHREALLTRCLKKFQRETLIAEHNARQDDIRKRIEWLNEQLRPLIEPARELKRLAAIRLEVNWQLEDYQVGGYTQDTSITQYALNPEDVPEIKLVGDKK